jgi:hypothetical protein
MHQQRLPTPRHMLLVSLAISGSLAAGPSHIQVPHLSIKPAAVGSSSSRSVVKVDLGTMVTTTPVSHSTGMQYALSGGTEVGADEFFHLSALTIVPHDVLAFNAAPNAKLVVLYVTSSQAQMSRHWPVAQARSPRCDSDKSSTWKPSIITSRSMPALTSAYRYSVVQVRPIPYPVATSLS